MYKWDGSIDWIGDEEFMARVCYIDGKCENITLPNSMILEEDIEHFEHGASICKKDGEDRIYFIKPPSLKPKHPILLNEMEMPELARKIADLRYDSLEELFTELRGCFLEDAIKDREAGRTRVAKYLSTMSNMTKDVEFQISKLWKVCENEMGEDK